jgi:hypothetical protein
MKRTVLTFGLIAGAIMSLEMIVGLPFLEKIGSLGAVLGYATMVVAFLMVYFGIRSYGDRVAPGSIGSEGRLASGSSSPSSRASAT